MTYEAPGGSGKRQAAGARPCHQTWNNRPGGCQRCNLMLLGVTNTGSLDGHMLLGQEPSEQWAGGTSTSGS